MDWYKIKSILIAMFLLINIFLSGLVVYSNVRESNAARVELESAASVLKLSNINLSPDNVVSNPSKAYSITVSNPLADADAFAQRLLGGVPSLYGKEYQVEDKKLKISGVHFIYQNTAYNEVFVPDRKLIKSVKEELISMGFSMKYAKPYIKGNTIVFIQKVHGYELFGNRLTVTACDKGIITVTGSWSEITKIIPSDVASTSSSEALIEFLRDPTRLNDTCDIVSVKYGVGITLDSPDYRTAETTPLWKITLKDGEEFFYDARK